MQGGLQGRTALVTGAAGGIGTELTRALLKAGASVTASDVSEKSLFALNEKMVADGLAGKLMCHAFDVSDNAACMAAVAATAEQFGGLDILVNNAGLGMGAIRDDHFVNLVGIEEIEPEMWDRFVRTNLSGAWYLTRAAVPGHEKARLGPHRHGDDEHVHDAARQVSSLWSVEGGAGGDVGRACAGVLGRRHHGQRRRPGRANRYGDGAGRARG